MSRLRLLVEKSEEIVGSLESRCFLKIHTQTLINVFRSPYANEDIKEGAVQQIAYTFLQYLLLN